MIQTRKEYPQRKQRARQRLPWRRLEDDQPHLDYEYAPLTVDAQRELIIKAQAGDADANQRLVRSVLPRIHQIAKRQQVPRFSLQDRIAEGVLAVLDAIRLYDLQYDVPLVALVPRIVTWRLTRLSRQVSLFEPRDTPYRQKRLKACPYQGENPLIEFAPADILSDLAVSRGSEPDAPLLVREPLEQVLAWATANLPARSCVILLRRFWLEEALEDVGNRLGLSKQRVSQIEHKIVAKLHAAFPELVDKKTSKEPIPRRSPAKRAPTGKKTKKKGRQNARKPKPVC
jgi:RNA polymerase sigma factor (sigma-70 family)